MAAFPGTPNSSIYSPASPPQPQTLPPVLQQRLAILASRGTMDSRAIANIRAAGYQCARVMNDLLIQLQMEGIKYDQGRAIHALDLLYMAGAVLEQAVLLPTMSTAQDIPVSPASATPQQAYRFNP